MLSPAQYVNIIVFIAANAHAVTSWCTFFSPVIRMPILSPCLMPWHVNGLLGEGACSMQSLAQLYHRFKLMTCCNEQVLT